MIERKVWIQCESCQSHILVPNIEKGKRILCPMCNSACTIPDQEAVPAEYNEEYEIKNQTLVNEFYSVCPNCHTHYRFPHSMNKQEMLCLKCHTLFMPSFSTGFSGKKIDHNTRNDRSINLYEKLKKNTVGNRLKGGIRVCFNLVKIAESDAKGKIFKICLHTVLLFLLYLVINVPIVSLAYINLINPFLSRILISFITTYTTLALSDGCLLYFRNMRSNSGTIGDFLVCFSPSCFKLEFLKTIYLQGLYWIFSASSYLVNNPLLKLTYDVLGSLIVFLETFLIFLSILYFVDSENKSPWQCMQESKKVMRMNFFYILGAIIYNTIKYGLATTGLIILGSIILGLLAGFLGPQTAVLLLLIPGIIILFAIFIAWSFQSNAIYAVVYELTHD